MTTNSQYRHPGCFLDSIKRDDLYLVGDIIDIWALRKPWLSGYATRTLTQSQPPLPACNRARSRSTSASVTMTG